MLYTTIPNVPGIIYGQENKKRAWTQYKALRSQEYQNFVIQNTGLHINAEFPYLGASPDSLIQCDCHGKGVLEIKCPHNYRYEQGSKAKTSLLMKIIKLKLTTSTVIKFKFRCLY